MFGVKPLGILLAVSVVLEAPFSPTVTAGSRELVFRNPVSETKPVLHYSLKTIYPQLLWVPLLKCSAKCSLQLNCSVANAWRLIIVELVTALKFGLLFGLLKKVFLESLEIMQN